MVSNIELELIKAELSTLNDLLANDRLSAAEHLAAQIKRQIQKKIEREKAA